ncbi:MAG: hypothetical protein JWM86_1218 [Thermoleophilia bacterium]|nr:hypothetical protein [Thermoleophilia bacterium]
MPTGPLFYQPLVHARVMATPIGDTTVFGAQKVQTDLTNKAYENPKFKPAMDGILRGFEGLQAGLPGSKSLDVIQFSFDDAGYVANRVSTAMRLHPELFETASPDQAAEIGAKLVQEGQAELKENPGMKAVGDTLEVAPDVTHLFRSHWEGERPLQGEEVAYLGVTAARELQRAVTPLEPDATHPKLQWIEDSTAWLMGMWPGAAAKTAAALGIKSDAAKVEEVVSGWRGNMEAVEPKVVAPLRSLSALLGAAGISGGDDAARDAAFSILQSTPLDGVPAGIAQSIVAKQELPKEQAGYVGDRIVETGGTEGNIRGLLAELELMKRPVPVDPPGSGDGEVPPPANPTPGEPAPGEPNKPPVDPPTGEEPPKTDPPTGEEPPMTDPPKGEEPPKTDPPKTDPPKGEEPPKTDPPADQAALDAKQAAEIEAMLSKLASMAPAPAGDGPDTTDPAATAPVDPPAAPAAAAPVDPPA